MESDGERYLALLLDGPLQSWGFGSQFERRTTGLMPTKSGITGMLCAALGCEKGSEKEALLLAAMRTSHMLAISIPRSAGIRRLEDFHTVLNTRRASNDSNDDPVITRREYLLDSRFGIILRLPEEWAEKLAAAVQNPVWGIWLGRKCCIPAEPVCSGVFETRGDAERALVDGRSLQFLSAVRDCEGFESGNDTVRDQPISFGKPESSGSHLREYGVRRVFIQVAESEVADERPSPASEDS